MSNYDFTYSAEFDYKNSRCELVHAWELAQKLPGTVEGVIIITRTSHYESLNMSGAG